jgi:hypothetical protein
MDREEQETSGRRRRRETTVMVLESDARFEFCRWRSVRRPFSRGFLKKCHSTSESETGSQRSRNLFLCSVCQD